MAVRLRAGIPIIVRNLTSFRTPLQSSARKFLADIHPRTKVRNGVKEDAFVFLKQTRLISRFEIETDKETVEISVGEDKHAANLISTSDDAGEEGLCLEASEIDVEDFGYFDDGEEIVEVAPERTLPISLERGQQGVFDVEEIVTVLEDENGVDIQIIDVPPEARFVDHMVLVSGKSLRHMRAMAASIEWMYKKKKRKGDRPFKLEGRDCKDWLAMDLGNIAVHIFMPDTRQHYDLETLWTLGPEYDDQRHYVQDDGLNLSAADLFWLETSSTSESFPASESTDTSSKTSANEELLQLQDADVNEIPSHKIDISVSSPKT